MPSSILPDKIYFSISEVSNHFGVATSLLRYWETEFDALKPKRNKKGRRFYSKQDIELIHSIYQLVLYLLHLHFMIKLRINLRRGGRDWQRWLLNHF